MKYSVQFEIKEAKWSPVEELYNLEKKHDLIWIPKLRESHVYPTSFQKMLKTFATQGFSTKLFPGSNIRIQNPFECLQNS